MWWRCFNINAVDELQILQSLVVTTCKLFIWIVFFTSSIFSSLTDIDMSLIFFVNWLWLLEKMLLHEWKLCMTTFLIMQRSNIVQTALNWDLLTLLTSIQTQNRIKRFVVNIMYRWILLSIMLKYIRTIKNVDKMIYNWDWIYHKALYIQNFFNNVICYDSSYASTLIAMLMTIVDRSSLDYRVVSRSTLFRVSLCFSESYR